jgi:hypothetical protein
LLSVGSVEPLSAPFASELKVLSQAIKEESMKGERPDQGSTISMGHAEEKEEKKEL